MTTQYYKDFFAELEMYERSGVSIKMNGYPASPMQVVTAHMAREDQTYMRDYVLDEDGRVRELAFQNVKSR